jgi:hypothetical protein
MPFEGKNIRIAGEKVEEGERKGRSRQDEKEMERKRVACLHKEGK